MKSASFKKLFAVLGLLIIMTPAVFLFSPQKSEAVVPVIDFANLTPNSLTAAGTGALVEKEFVLDAVLWALVKNIIASLINDVTNWARTGFEGQPLFITNMRDFLLEAANEASGVFIDEYLSQETQDLLCQPWSTPVYLKIAGQDRPALLQPDRYNPDCTLEDIINSSQGMREYMGDFRYGGWDAWLSMTAKPENNPFGSYITALDTLDTTIKRAEARADTEAKMNAGFKSAANCDSRSPSGYCQHWSIDSPGKWVEEQVSLYTSSGLRTLEIADELSELLGSMVDFLVNRLISEGLGGEQGGAPGPIIVPPAPAPTDGISALLTAIDQSITDTTQFRNTHLSAISAYQNAITGYQQAVQCYQGYVADWNACVADGCTASASYRPSPFDLDPPPTSLAAVQGAITDINTEITNIQNTIIPGIQAEIAQIDILLADLENLRNRTQNATTAQELENLYNEFMVMRSRIPTPYDQYLSDRQLTDGQNALSGARNNLNDCRQISPPACDCPEGEGGGGGGGGLPPGGTR